MTFQQTLPKLVPAFQDWGTGCLIEPIERYDNLNIGRNPVEHALEIAAVKRINKYLHSLRRSHCSPIDVRRGSRMATFGRRLNFSTDRCGLSRSG